MRQRCQRRCHLGLHASRASTSATTQHSAKTLLTITGAATRHCSLHKKDTKRNPKTHPQWSSDYALGSVRAYHPNNETRFSYGLHTEFNAIQNHISLCVYVYIYIYKYLRVILHVYNIHMYIYIYTYIFLFTCGFNVTTRIPINIHVTQRLQLCYTKHKESRLHSNTGQRCCCPRNGSRPFHILRVSRHQINKKKKGNNYMGYEHPLTLSTTFHIYIYLSHAPPAMTQIAFDNTHIMQTLQPIQIQTRTIHIHTWRRG